MKAWTVLTIHVITFLSCTALLNEHHLLVNIHNIEIANSDQKLNG